MDEEQVDSSGQQRRRRRRASSRRQLLNNSETPQPAPGTSEDLEDAEDVLNGSPPAKTPRSEVKQQQVSAETLPSPPPDKILGINVIRADALSMSKHFISQVVVRAYVSDITTGAYSKSFSGRPFQPVTSKPCFLQKIRSAAPVWNDHLFLDVPYSSLQNGNSVLLFEILENDTEEDNEIAWAFLSPSGIAACNGNQVRLQLYKYSSSLFSWASREDTNYSAAFKAWKQNFRNKYNGSIYIEVYASDSFAVTHAQELQMDTGPVAYKKVLDNDKTDTVSQAVQPIPWRRVLGQRCKLPNRPILVIDGGKRGCSSIAFSSSGFYFAAACAIKDGYSIKVFDTISGSRIVRLEGHLDVIVDLQWSEDERYLMSASLDGSVRVWNILQERINQPELTAVFQHLSFVTAAKFLPTNSDDVVLVVTAANYKTILIWSFDRDGDPSMASSNATPAGKIDGHSNPVTAITFSHNKSHMFTGDSEGRVKIWLFSATDDGTLRLSFDCVATISVDTFNADPVNTIAVHFNDRHALVQTCSGKIRILDLRIQRVVSDLQLPQPLATGSHEHPFISAIFSPCGKYVISSGFNCDVCVFSADSSHLVATYSKLGYSASVASISFHPFDHSIAFGSVGDKEPLLVYTWDESCPEMTQPTSEQLTVSPSKDEI